MHCRPQDIGPPQNPRILHRKPHPHRHRAQNHAEAGRPLGGKLGRVLVPLGQAEHQPEHPRPGPGEIDIGLPDRRNRLERTGRMPRRRRLHRGAKPVHAFRRHRAQKFRAVPEMLVGRRRADTCPARGLGHGKPVGTVHLDQVAHGGDQLRAQIAMMIGGFAGGLCHRSRVFRGLVSGAYFLLDLK